MAGDFVHIGFGNILAMGRAIAIASPSSAPIKRSVQAAKDRGVLIDMTSGRRTKSVIFTDSGHIILAAITPETISSRLLAGRDVSLSRAEDGDDRDVIP